ncbi:MAG TPA: DUF2218 domain-containing protein [Acetobacteraceae bacterium]|jgi:hypothetical protein|nr:DUF2218 domain-containing protein [Acetobacteraceae bacterium]
MPSSEAHVAMATPTRYLTQLCKHFEHRLPVTHDGAAGRIAFEAGTCDLRASADALVMRCDAADDEALARVQDVVARHLLRFAFRDPPEIVWAPRAR